MAVAMTACGVAAPSPPTDWSQQSSASSGGGLTALVVAAKKEGVVNVPWPPPSDWAGYNALIDGFQSRYGIRVSTVSAPSGAGQLRSSSLDVFDMQIDTAAANTRQFAPYLVFYWLEIPPALKDGKAYWYDSCGGYMSIGYDPRYVPPITALSDLTKPGYKIGIEIDPTAVAVMASLNSGGTAGNVAPGVQFFRELNASGNLVHVIASRPPVWVDWDYALPEGYRNFVPRSTVLAFDAQAINRHAPHPAAARLWEEYLSSDSGQNLCVRTGARPSRLAAMRSDGVLDIAAADALAPAPSDAVVLTAPQMAAARSYVEAHWTAAVS